MPEDDSDDIIQSFGGCEVTCPAMRQKDEELVEKDEIIERLNELLSDETHIQKINDLPNSFKDIKFQPIFNYITEKSKANEGISAVLIGMKNFYLDIWFILEQDEISLKEKISQIAYDLMDDFDTMRFDFMLLIKNEEEIKHLVQENYKPIYFKGGDELRNANARARKPMEI